MPDSVRPFRLLHTSDWHLGHELFGHAREAEHDAFLAWLLDTLRTEAPDLLLVTGDIYDVANPPVSAMARLYRFLSAATAQLPLLQIAMIGGNHDSASRIELPAALLGPGRVHLLGQVPRANGRPDCAKLLLPLHDRDGQTSAWLAAVPYCRAGDLGPGGLSALYAETIEAGARLAGALPLIVTGHLHVAGGAVSELSERRIVIGGEEAEATTLFDARAAYVALGHLHRPQAIAGAATIRYAGSPFPLSATERDYSHSVCLIDLGPDGTQVHELPIPRPAAFMTVPADGPRPLAEVEAALIALELDPAVPRGLQPFVEVSVLVDGPEPDLATRVLAALEGKAARFTRVQRVAARIGVEGRLNAVEADLAALDPANVFATLFGRTHGAAPPDDLARAFAALLVEAGEAKDA